MTAVESCEDRRSEEDVEDDRRNESDDLPGEDGAREVTLRRGGAGAEGEHQQVDDADHWDAAQEEGEHP